MTRDELQAALPTTHDELVDRAGRWLLNSCRCKLVIVRAQPWSCREHPDAIGWNHAGESVVLECKMSRDDFRADRQKAWRTHGAGMGGKRFYMIPESLWQSDGAHLCVPQGIGLLIVGTRRVTVQREAEGRQDRDWAEEICLLVSRLSNGRALLDGKVDILALEDAT